MIYKIIIGLLLFSTLLYYIFCFLEVFEFIKFTGKNTTIKIPLMLIPFYYLVKKDDPEPVVEDHKPVKKKRKVVKIKNIESK